MPWAAREPLAGPVARLGCYRGIAELTALTLAAEVVDWRRFPAARMFMGWTGLVPAEYSSGERTRRGRITRPARAGPLRADRGGVGLPAPPGDRRGAGPPPGRRRPGHPGPVVEGAAAAARPLPASAAVQGRAGGGRRGRPRAGRVHLGRDDRLNPGPDGPPEPVAYRDARRRRNDPRHDQWTPARLPAKSLGHHPADDRPAIPIRAYESGSDRQQPSRRPGTPPQPSPPAARPGPARQPHARPPDCPSARNAGVKGACGVAARALRAPVTPRTAREIRQRSRPRGHTSTPPHPLRQPGKPAENHPNQAPQQQKLDRPLHMRSWKIRLAR